jgi:hypothetical protein
MFRGLKERFTGGKLGRRGLQLTHGNALGGLALTGLVRCRRRLSEARDGLKIERNRAVLAALGVAR